MSAEKRGETDGPFVRISLTFLVSAVSPLFSCPPCSRVFRSSLPSSLLRSLRSPCLVVLGSLVLLAYGSRNGVECGECKEPTERSEVTSVARGRKAGR